MPKISCFQSDFDRFLLWLEIRFRRMETRSSCEVSRIKPCIGSVMRIRSPALIGSGSRVIHWSRPFAYMLDRLTGNFGWMISRANDFYNVATVGDRLRLAKKVSRESGSRTSCLTRRIVFFRLVEDSRFLGPARSASSVLRASLFSAWYECNTSS